MTFFIRVCAEAANIVVRSISRRAPSTPRRSMARVVRATHAAMA